VKHRLNWADRLVAVSDALDDFHEDLPEQMRVRREKLDRLRREGVDPYPVTFPRTTTIAEVRAKHGDLAPDVYTGERVALTGRVMLYRTGGKLCFATIRDASGDIQVMLSLDRVGAERLAAWKSDVDLGDHIGVEGEVITSRRGELSILADTWTLTSKCLRPLPDKHKGLTDPEARVRQRYVDLIVNPESREMVMRRARTVRALRDGLHNRGYIEVETPMLQQVHGGATARPFVTHINAYDLDLYLRIAPELYLKRMVVGGVEKVFEINRNFRNEGADSTHNPEFTMLEFYQAYADYNVMADITRELIQSKPPSQCSAARWSSGATQRSTWAASGRRSPCTARSLKRWAKKSLRGPRWRRCGSWRMRAVSNGTRSGVRASSSSTFSRSWSKTAWCSRLLSGTTRLKPAR
jgi:lysyl-tRNA synthetase class 2